MTTPVAVEAVSVVTKQFRCLAQSILLQNEVFRELAELSLKRVGLFVELALVSCFCTGQSCFWKKQSCSCNSGAISLHSRVVPVACKAVSIPDRAVPTTSGAVSVLNKAFPFLWSYYVITWSYSCGHSAVSILSKLFLSLREIFLFLAGLFPSPEGGIVLYFDRAVPVPWSYSAKVNTSITWHAFVCSYIRNHKWSVLGKNVQSAVMAEQARV
jgi:hypothetical protein